MERQAMTDSDRPGAVNPQRLMWELSGELPDQAIVTADSGSAANWYARHLKLRGHQRGSLSGNLATMGPGVPYAIGAKFAHPDRPAVALVGDGAMQMNGMAELLTVSRYWQRWEDPRLVIAVLHNNDLNQVTWEMRAMSGVPKFADSQDLPNVSYAAFAASIGLRSMEVTRAEDIALAWKEAFAADRPTVLDVHADPDIPPIPPHATLQQMRDMAKSLAGGDENLWGVIKTGIKQKAQEILPGKNG
jgi:pyruvate dehydrogenase (quinone)